MKMIQIRPTISLTTADNKPIIGKMTKATCEGHRIVALLLLQIHVEIQHSVSRNGLSPLLPPGDFEGAWEKLKALIHQQKLIPLADISNPYAYKLRASILPTQTH